MSQVPDNRLTEFIRMQTLLWQGTQQAHQLPREFIDLILGAENSERLAGIPGVIRTSSTIRCFGRVVIWNQKLTNGW